jgi:hypothetical protein
VFRPPSKPQKKRVISIGYMKLAGAPGFEPGDGGIKIRLIIEQFQSAFGKNRSKHGLAVSIA